MTMQQLISTTITVLVMVVYVPPVVILDSPSQNVTVQQLDEMIKELKNELYTQSSRLNRYKEELTAISCDIANLK